MSHIFYTETFDLKFFSTKKLIEIRTWLQQFSFLPRFSWVSYTKKQYHENNFKRGQFFQFDFFWQDWRRSMAVLAMDYGGRRMTKQPVIDQSWRWLRWTCEEMIDHPCSQASRVSTQDPTHNQVLVPVQALADNHSLWEATARCPAATGRSTCTRCTMKPVRGGGLW